jgi:DNA adenine methylase
MQLTGTKARPFLKWAGGKGQLLDQLENYFPPELRSGTIQRYVEPFIGGGAVFFHVAQTYGIEQYFIGDLNEELVLAYTTVQRDAELLIDVLSEMKSIYHCLSLAKQEEYFYDIRSKFNSSRGTIDFTQFQPAWIERTAQIIFLNRTCFNGLFRVNAAAEFNVPFGRYKNPQICSAGNLRDVAELLRRAEILHGDFAASEKFIDERTFVYFDPPYRPISKTASFTSYSRYEFDDAAQRRLAEYYRLINERGAKLMLSNSDPKNENADDHFFEQAYKGFRIERVKASRNINSDGRKRGAINELLIMNY